MLHSQMAGAEDNDGAFDFVVAKLRRGTEPPPHVHSREHEFMYLLSGEIRFYVEAEVFTVKWSGPLFRDNQLGLKIQ